MDLRYDYFFVNISLSMREFGRENFPGTPALDFVYRVLAAAENAHRGIPGQISFTENDLLISLVPDGTEVTVTRSWDPAAATCSVDDLVAASCEFCKDLIDDTVRKYPAFQGNPFFSKLQKMQAALSCGCQASSRDCWSQ